MRPGIRQPPPPTFSRDFHGEEAASRRDGDGDFAVREDSFAVASISGGGAIFPRPERPSMRGLLAADRPLAGRPSRCDRE